MKAINLIFSSLFFFVIHPAFAQISIPHCSNFNGANLWNVTTVSGSAWQLGLPQYGATNSTHSPPRCFDIELNAAYLPSTVTYLQSPAFNLLSAPNSRMSFWLNYNSEVNWDGARLEYTIDNGITWFVLGSMNDVMASNWYNSNAILSSNLPAWHGSSGGWKKSTYNLTAFNNQPNISFRFVFTSDGAICTDGFSVDDFCITQAPDVDLRMDSVYIPAIVSANAVVPVDAKVVNMGLLPISNFNVYYNLNGTVQGPFVYSGTLQPGGAAIVNCGNLATTAGANTIKIYTVATNDADLTNDTIIRQMFVVGSSSLGCDDFESQSSWVAMPATGANSWMLGMPTYSLTTGTHSGNNAWDINLATSVGAGTATLQSPTYTLSGNQPHQISFWINHALSTGYNGTTLLYSLNGSPYQPLGIVNDPNAINWFNQVSTQGVPMPCWGGNTNGWKKCTYTLPASFTGQLQLQLLFGAVQFDIGFSFDDFCIYPVANNNAAVDAIVSPGINSISGSKLPLIARIANHGINAISNVPVYYQLNGATSVGPFIISSTILPATDTLFALDSIVLNAGLNNVCVYTQYPNDTLLMNDTACQDIAAITPLALPYFNNFDLGDTLWHTEQNSPATVWQLGTPTFGATNSAYTAPNCWDINLNTGYNNLAQAYLYTPIFNFSTAVNPGLRFYYNCNIEPNWDGFRLEYKLSSGTWQVLGSVGLPGSTNWYNTANIISSGLPGWSGNSLGWKEAVLPNLGAFIGQPAVQFRFVFTADNTGQLDGVSIDNFELTEPLNNAVANMGINIGPLPVVAGNIKTVETLVTNSGILPLTHCRIHVIVNNVLVTNDSVNFNPPLLYNQSKWVTSLYNLPAGNNTICTQTLLPNSVIDGAAFDNEQCVTHPVLTVVSSYPHCRDFEASNEAYLSINLSNNGYNNFWVKGKPNKPTLNSAYSGNNCLVTGISNNYQSNTDVALYTDAYNVTQGNCYKLSFMHHMKTEYLVDGGLVEYSYDGVYWFSLGYVGEVTWYNTNALSAFTGLPKQGWSGATFSWTQAWHEFYPAATGTCLFRFRFKSNQTNNDEGWAIDDICMEQIATPCIASLEEKAQKIQIYPNPASQILQIKFEAKGNDMFEIYNTQGQLVLEKSITGNTHFINVSSLDDGVYYIKIKSNVIWQKFVIVH